MSAPPKYEIGPQEVVEIKSEVDGVAIEIAIFRPRGAPDGERFPVILNATPYHHAMKTLDVRACKAYYVENYAPQGYAVAFVTVRGTGNSGGCMNLFGPAERADLDTAVTWLGSQSWSTGSVGMIGLSYEGSTPWMVAARGNPHLKTIVSAAGVPDVFELLFGGGNIDFRGPLLLNDLYYLPSIVTYADGREPDRTVGATACPEYAIGNQAAAYSSVTGEPDPAGYWAERRYRHEIEERYRGSVLISQGFNDLNVPPGNQFPWIQQLQSRGVPVKLWLGWYGHSNPDEAGGDATRADWPDVLLRWFDRWLKGADVDTGPAVDVQDSEGRWRTESSWPPEGETRTLHLGADAGLHDAPPSGTAERLLVPDPVHTQVGVFTVPSTPLDADCAIPNCAAFTLGPVGEQLHFAGRPALDLTVTPTADAGHVSAYLYAVDSSGAWRIGWGQADVRFPDGDGRRRTATPGQPMRLRLDLQPLDSVVPAGAKLVLVLSQGAAYDRNPSVPTAPLRLSVGGAASTVRLALVER